MIEDAETFFSHKGHVVLMVMIKLGGLNIIAFGSLLSLLARFGVGIRQHDVIEDFVNRGSILGSRGTLGRVILWSIAIELVGALALFLFWPGGLFESTGDRMFNSLFLSISAFNNAGISLFSGGLADLRSGQCLARALDGDTSCVLWRIGDGGHFRPVLARFLARTNEKTHGGKLGSPPKSHCTSPWPLLASGPWPICFSSVARGAPSKT